MPALTFDKKGPYIILLKYRDSCDILCVCNYYACFILFSFSFFLFNDFRAEITFCEWNKPLKCQHLPETSKRTGHNFGNHKSCDLWMFCFVFILAFSFLIITTCWSITLLPAPLPTVNWFYFILFLRKNDVKSRQSLLSLK